MESEQSEDAPSLNEKDDSISSIIKIEIVTDDTVPLPDGGNNVSSQVNVGSDKDMVTVNNNLESTGSEVQEKPHENPTTLTGIRYFKGIGQDVAKNTSTSLPVDKTLTLDSNIFIKPVEPYSVSIVHQKAAGSNSESRLTNTPMDQDMTHGTFELYAEDTGPKMYNVKGNIVSRPIITKNLPKAFRAQPVHGKAESKAALSDFFEQKIRDYIGYGISDSEFGKLQKYMDGDFLRTGLECTTPYSFPSQGPLSIDLKSNPPENGPGKNLCTVKKLQLRLKKDLQNHYPRKLKYRGLRMRPLSLEDEDHITEMPVSTAGALDGSEDGPLEPGKDLIFRARIYRPHSYGAKHPRDNRPTRHSVFNNDLVALGRQRLTAFRDRIACANDIGMRVDVSDNPDCYTTESAKHIFPSGFLFINNVFYVDRRAGCRDQSAGIRDWARRRGLGDFPVRDMADVRLDDIVLRLGHPEVYMHQGKCEHLFTFSEVRLVGARDPQRAALYPRCSHITRNQSVYCTTCAEFGAKWVVVGCARVPFDPAFFCDTCFRFYLYDGEGKKIGDFKAYSYKGNTVNFMKPIAGKPATGDDSNGDDDSE